MVCAVQTEGAQQSPGAVALANRELDGPGLPSRRRAAALLAGSPLVPVAGRLLACSLAHEIYM